MNLTYINAGDWEGLYIDGALAEEGHSINWSDVLPKLVGFTIDSVQTRWDVDLDEWGACPYLLSELPL